MRPSIRLGKIGGVDIGLHYSWFATVALLSWSLADGIFPEQYPGWSAATYWIIGVVAVLMLFASVLVHELAHSLVAKARGFRVDGITLFLLGGVSNLQSDARHPRDEFLIAAVGPLSSFLLGGVFWIALLGFDDRSTPLPALVWYLAFINVLLGAFNLLPAFPMDGGRVLRSTVWAATGSLSKATNVAALGGQGIGVLLMAIGAFSVLNGNLLGGLWMAFIGWFLQTSAASSRREQSVASSARGVSVKDVMDPDPVTIGPDAALSEVVFDHLMRGGARSLPVLVGDSLMGIVTLTDIKRVPRDRWDVVSIRDVMTPAPLWHVRPDDDLERAMALLGEHSVHCAPVLEGDRLVGLISRAHILGYLHSRRELGIR